MESPFYWNHCQQLIGGSLSAVSPLAPFRWTPHEIQEQVYKINNSALFAGDCCQRRIRWRKWRLTLPTSWASQNEKRSCYSLDFQVYDDHDLSLVLRCKRSSWSCQLYQSSPQCVQTIQRRQKCKPVLILIVYLCLVWISFGSSCNGSWTLAFWETRIGDDWKESYHSWFS